MSDVDAMLRELEARSTPRLVLRDRDELSPWETDWRGRWTGRAAAMIQPMGVADVQAAVRAAARHRVALVPQGGNSSMVGGATPSAAGDQVLVSLRRMTAVRSLSPGHATVETGVVLQRLHELAANEGARFPLTLGARGTATVGGLVSTAAGGTQVLRHGTMRALVTGVEVVLADGSVLSTLDPLPKDSRGPDPTGLFVGAEGTLGIVTAATLRLVPRAVDRAVAWVGVASPRLALGLLRELEAALPGQVEGFELISRATLHAAIAHRPGDAPPIASDPAWHALIEAVGGGDVGERFAKALSASPAVQDAAIASSEAQAEALWVVRDGLSSAEKAWGPSLSFDLSVPVERLPEFVADMECAVPHAFPDHSVSGFGHLGDGNIHLHVRAPAGRDRDEWELALGTDIARWIHDRITAAGGSISAEHGIGRMKRDEHARLGDPVRLAVQAALKAAFDPLGLFNPGKLHPDS